MSTPFDVLSRVLFEGTEDQLSKDPFEEIDDFDFWEEKEPDWFNKRDENEPFKLDLPGTGKGGMGRQVSQTSSATGLVNQAGVQGASNESWYKKYDNGQIPGDALSPLKMHPGHSLRADAAANYTAMVKAARKDGVSWGMTDSYRDYATQVRLAAEKGLYSQGGLAAQPGTSEHGWGLATDLDLDAEAQNWLQNNAGKYGFATIPREPWHWEYQGGGISASKTSGGGRKKKDKPKPRRPDRSAQVRAAAATSRRATMTSLNPLPGSSGLLAALQNAFADDPIERANRQPMSKGGGGGKLKYVPDEYRRWVHQAAKEFGVPAKLMAAVGQLESGWDPNAVSSAGAKGVGQVMPEWYDDLTAYLGTQFNPHNPRHGIIGMGYILGRNLKAGGSVKDALSLYYSGKPYAESSDGQWYAGEVLALMGR